MEAEQEIKSMKLYNDVERIYKELEQMGYRKTDPLKVEDVAKFDQYHYYGTSAVMECIEKLGISFSHKVLDFGSGLGGPARFIASKTKCQVLAMELQPDLNETALDLTTRCGLSKWLTHKCGDILQLDVPDSSFDFLVNWLVILHIEDRKTLFSNCYRLLKPGGKIYTEDFYKLSEFNQTIDKILQEELYTPYLPSKSEYVKHMEDAGFTDIQFEDLTNPWRSFVDKRCKNFIVDKEKHVRVLGQETYDALLSFYSRIDMVVNEFPHVGGCRIIATKA